MVYFSNYRVQNVAGLHFQYISLAPGHNTLSKEKKTTSENKTENVVVINGRSNDVEEMLCLAHTRKYF